MKSLSPNLSQPHFENVQVSSKWARDMWGVNSLCRVTFVFTITLSPLVSSSPRTTRRPPFTNSWKEVFRGLKGKTSEASSGQSPTVRQQESAHQIPHGRVVQATWEAALSSCTRAQVLASHIVNSVMTRVNISFSFLRTRKLMFSTDVRAFDWVELYCLHHQYHPLHRWSMTNVNDNGSKTGSDSQLS